MLNTYIFLKKESRKNAEVITFISCTPMMLKMSQNTMQTRSTLRMEGMAEASAFTTIYKQEPILNYQLAVLLHSQTFSSVKKRASSTTINSWWWGRRTMILSKLSKHKSHFFQKINSTELINGRQRDQLICFKPTLSINTYSNDE